MRHIPKDRVRAKVSQAWRERATAVAQQIIDANAGERAALIDKNDGLWAELKNEFESLLNDKCWYSESQNPGCDKDMDHFRPKKGVWGTDHPGYWWLAFDWENYRFCCQFSNRLRTDPTNNTTGGKSTQFPLLNPASRVRDHTVKVHEFERPLLLDPLVATDPSLLSFESDGRAVARWPKDERPEDFERADKSAEIYNLNFKGFRKARAKLYGEIEGLIEEGAKFVQADGRTVRPGHENAFNLVVGELLRRAHIDTEYSAAARHYIRLFRSRPWVDEKVVHEF